MKKFDITHYRLGPAGKHCSILTKGDLVDEMKVKYGRNVALKIFELNSVTDQESLFNAKWGDDPVGDNPRKNNTVFESAQIQNILSWYELSGRVYGLETLYFGEKLIPMQVIEFVEGDFYHSDDANEIKKVTKEIDELGARYGFKALVRKISKQDIIDGKLIDSHPYFFDVPYYETAKRIYGENRYGKVYYQDVPELGLKGGPRKSTDRVNYLGLDRIKFDGMKVLDIGCAGGYFTRYAADRGARRVVGIDLPDQLESARNLANLLGYWNNDYHAVDLQKDTWDTKQADIVFFLSLNFHIGVPKQVLDAPMVIFEDNGKESRSLDKLGEPWTSHFSSIEFVGRALDHGDKAIYHLRK